MKNIAILGSTGSIGQNALDVLARHPHQFKVFALAANHNDEIMLRQCLLYQPQIVVMCNTQAANRLRVNLKQHKLNIQVWSGEKALVDVATLAEVDDVLAAIVGAAGLLSTLAAAKAGKRILLANKEALVMSGALLMNTVQKNNAILLPVDSEHNALFQCMPANYLPGQRPDGVTRLLLTASGGAFRDWPIEQLALATPEQACTHPNWIMGKKITVDCATMLNKALEVIEAYWLYQMPPEKIEVILHPQSIIHSFVEYEDGSVLAQLGEPDMRIPIANVLAWPTRIQSGVKWLDLLTVAKLEFLPWSKQRYPCLQLAYDVLALGGTAMACLNAANEVAVQAFLDRRIIFTEIYAIVAAVLEALPAQEADSLEAVLVMDTNARLKAEELIGLAKALVYTGHV